MDVLVNYAWVIWIGLILLFGIIEMTTLEFTFLMLAIGSTGGLISDLLGAPFLLQAIVAAVLSLLLLFAVRPRLLKALKRGGDPTRSNVDALIGLDGVVTNDFSGNANHVKLANGETWTARLMSGRPLVEGELVTVTAIEGATAVVVPAERTAS
ncbi:MAG: NfeD family protein [Salinibacterium sp.]|nr:MAG: NfeD family protein [Salinibacterium sp.]